MNSCKYCFVTCNPSDIFLLYSSFFVCFFGLHRINVLPFSKHFSCCSCKFFWTEIVVVGAGKNWRNWQTVILRFPVNNSTEKFIKLDHFLCHTHTPRARHTQAEGIHGIWTCMCCCSFSSHVFVFL